MSDADKTPNRYAGVDINLQVEFRKHIAAESLQPSRSRALEQKTFAHPITAWALYYASKWRSVADLTAARGHTGIASNRALPAH